MPIDLSSAYDKVQVRAEQIADDAADLVVQMAQADAPVSEPSETNNHSGQMRDALMVLDSFQEGNVLVRSVGVDPASPAAVYSDFTDEVDTAPHEILPVNTQFLRFFWDHGPSGPGIYYMRGVMHPGTTGRRWFHSQNESRWSSALRQAAAS